MKAESGDIGGDIVGPGKPAPRGDRKPDQSEKSMSGRVRQLTIGFLKIQKNVFNVSVILYCNINEYKNISLWLLLNTLQIESDCRVCSS